jgi:diguanylate cyclase (GGDEF)-like protein/PAS domain S-box-containing protein
MDPRRGRSHPGRRDHARARQAEGRAARYREAARWAEELRKASKTREDLADTHLKPESLTEEVLDEEEEAHLQQVKLLDRLRASQLASDRVAAIESLVERYGTLAQQHFAWMRRHHPGELESEKHYEATADPLSSELNRSSRELAEHLSSRADADRQLADRFVFAFGPMLALSMLAGLAFRRGERFRHRAAVRELEARHDARLRSLMRNAADLVCVTDADGRCTFATPSAKALLGVAAEEVLGRSLDEFAEAPVTAGSIASAGTGSPAKVSMTVRHADGAPRRLTGTCLDLSHDESVGGLVWNLRDVTEQHQLEARLTWQAHHDGLTGLANRALFHERAEQRLASAQPTGNPATLMLLDVDDFKGINDTLGHAAGDSVLTTIADRIQTCVRSGDLVARLGGDEFAILLEDADAATAEGIARRLVELLGRPHVVEGTEIRPTASIGVAIGGAHVSSVDELLRFADAAMYAVKSMGRAAYRVFDAEQAEDGIARGRPATDRVGRSAG